MLRSKENVQEIDIDLSYMKRTFNLETDYLRKHIEICSETTEKQRELIENELNEKIEENPDKESEINSLFEERIRTINCHFYHSSLLLVYANLENYLNIICTNIEEQTMSPLLIRNIRAQNNMLVIKSFFELTSDIGDLVNEFSDFNNYRLLRNSIAHNNSKIINQKDFKTIKKRFEEEIDFDDSSNGFFIVEKDFIFNLLNKIITFIHALCNKIESDKYLSFRVNNDD